MSSLFSPSWYRVSTLKPRLRSHVQVHRQPYRDELSYLIQDHSNGKFYRFNPSAHEIVGRMNGERTVHEIWESAVAHLGDNAPSQDETIELLGRLHSADALQMSVTPDCAELFRRSEQHRGRKLALALKSPLSVKVPLVDPDRLLEKWMPYLGGLITRKALALWCVVVGLGAFLAIRHWSALTTDAAVHALEPINLLLLSCIYPIVKALHELGHALTTKKWGGEVHEMGINFLVFMPIPYVDASAASAIESKRKRMAVGAAGMAVELFLAALALFVWLMVEPGVVRLAALNVMLISGVSTVLFNGNPLMRFDAYHIMKDAIEVPNLGVRSTRQLGYLIQHHVFGVRDLDPPSHSRRERRWLTLYGLSSTPYRVWLTFQIVFFVAQQYFVVGVLLAIWAGFLQVILPLWKHGSFLLFDPRLRQQRTRAVGITAAVGVVSLSLVCFVPLPEATVAQGVVWLPDDARVRSDIDGHVERVVAAPFSRVAKGEALIALDAPVSRAQIGALRAELEELEVRMRIERTRDPVVAEIQREELKTKQAELDRALDRESKLMVRSPTDGFFVLVHAEDLPGRFVNQGDELALVVEPSTLVVRTVVTQDDIGLVRERIESVDVKLTHAMGETIAARVLRSVPAAEKRLPSKALGSTGGGPIMVDPSDADGLAPVEPIFQYDIALEQQPKGWWIGTRAYVKFDHGDKPLALQWYRRTRQLFLSSFGV